MAAKLEKVQLKSTIKVRVPKKVYDQIQYLCRCIPKEEWSGILFYNMKGTILEPENLELVLEDILPMDKGTKTFTEYSFGTKLAEHMMNNPELEDCKIGLIHSHNTMPVFFSSVDISELEDNVVNHNFYLSVIVNNYMDIEAKVATLGSTESVEINVEYKARNEKGEFYIIDTEKKEINSSKMFIYNCDIETGVKEIEVSDDFIEKTKNIISEKEMKKEKTIAYNNATTNYFTKNPNFKKKYSSGVKNFGQKPQPKKSIYIKKETPEYLEYIEEFGMYLLNGAKEPDKDINFIEDILEKPENIGLSEVSFSRKIIDIFPKAYDKFYESFKGKESFEMYVGVIEGLIEWIEQEIQNIDLYLYTSFPTSNESKKLVYLVEQLKEIISYNE